MVYQPSVSIVMPSKAAGSVVVAHVSGPCLLVGYPFSDSPRPSQATASQEVECTAVRKFRHGQGRD